MDSAQAKLFADSLLGKMVGGWLLTRVLGCGKSAVVFAGSKATVNAAVKVFHPELVERYGREKQLERIAREKSLIGTQHPNLVQIFDGGECEATGQLFVVMECIPYPNLAECIQHLPLDSVPGLIAQIASAAQFLEDRSLVHRDIKPENIAVSSDYSTAVLLDLGVLRPLGRSNLTDEDQRLFVGTLRYSSPEFLLREEEQSLDGYRALTFYQLGAVLHDMLMRRPLFSDHSEPFSALVRAVGEVVPAIHSELTRYVALANNCLVKKPGVRLQLVKWADFSNQPADYAGQTRATVDLIKQRQRYFQTTQTGSATGVDRSDALRRVLRDIGNRFATRLTIVVNGMDCFPLRTTRSHQHVTDARSTTTLIFEPDDSKGLPDTLSVMFEVTLVDENQGRHIWRARIAAALSVGEVGEDQLQPTTEFFIGDEQALADSALLEQQLSDVLMAAYEAYDKGNSPKESSIVRLIN